MSTTPDTIVRGDEILVGDLFGIGGALYTVLSNSKERGEDFITMQLSSENAVAKETKFAELTINIDSLFFVLRK
jgi:hypothetical protein